MINNPNIKYKNDAEYYSRTRVWPFLFDIKRGSRVLDVGCGTGELGKLLSFELGCRVTGIEIIEENYKKAEGVLEEVLLGDVELISFPENDFKFDYIIFSDSLEHTLNPDIVLERVASFLDHDGKLLISMPNVRNFRVTLPLLFCDSWEYEEEGLLDKTHLRFFTQKSLINLLNSKKFDVEVIKYDLPINSKVGVLNAISFGMIKKHLTSHYFVQSCLKKY